MPQDDINRLLSELPRLVSEWQAGTIASQEGGFQRLTELLTHSSAARSYFLEAMQIEAELRWRFGANSKVSGALAVNDDGSTRPIAEIAANEISYRDDRGFCLVFDGLQEQETLANQWVQLYPVVRAVLFFCVPSYVHADELVFAACEGILGRLQDAQTPAVLSDIAIRSVLSDIEAYFVENPHKSGRLFLETAQECLKVACSMDTIAFYESLESITLSQVSPDDLRLLCLRYLVGLRQAQIAKHLALDEPAVQAKLAAARLRVLNSSVSPAILSQPPSNLDWLSPLSLLLDRHAEQSGAPRPEDLGAPVEQGLTSLLSHLDKKENRQCLLVYLIVHESLHRHLSLDRLLELSKSHRAPAFQLLISEIVREIENTSKVHSPTPVLSPAKWRSEQSLVWGGVVAAALLVAITAGAWLAGRGVPASDEGARLAEHAPAPPGAGASHDPVDAGEPEPEPQPEPRIVAGVVTTVLETDDNKSTGRAPEAGEAVYVSEEFKIDTGIVQVDLPSGNRWILEGPTSIVMHEGDRVFLRAGKLVGKNEGGGKPLVVETPGAVVRDIGTEFGVAVREDKRTSVAVYEGEVQLSASTANHSAGPHKTLNIDADHEVALGPSDELPVSAELLAHDRAFVRPDEVRLRLDERAGSAAAAAQISFFELLRVDGLLAYQGFVDSADQGGFSIGFEPRPFRSELESRLGQDLTPGAPVLPESRSIRIANGENLFFHFDTSDRSLFAKSGLLDEARKLGRRAGDIWVSWRSKVQIQPGQTLKWVGLSLMNGEVRGTNEPLFLGLPSNFTTLGYHMYGDDERRGELDMNPELPGIQSQLVDDNSHLWVLHIHCRGEGHAVVQVFLDPDLTNIHTLQPNAELPIEDLAFDRVRLEHSAEGDRGECFFDEICVGTNAEAIAVGSRRD
ncbi:MAG: FecR domain-containing protein [Planctomycetales bacterium]|nr:FecR domain-containing protein [Planctomycetales bacterium]